MLDTLLKLDGDILLWIQDNLRAGWLDPIMKFITYPANAYIYGAVLVRHELYRAAYCMGADRAVYIVPAYCSCDNAGGRSYCRKAAYAQAFTGKDPLDRNGGHILAAYIFLDTFQGVCSCFIDADA